MTIDKAIMVMGGSVVIISALLSLAYPTGYWIYLTIFVGFNMVQSSFTGFCPPAFIMKKLGMKSEAEKAQESSTEQ